MNLSNVKSVSGQQAFSSSRSESIGHMGSSGNLFDNTSQYMQALDSMRKWLWDNLF